MESNRQLRKIDWNWIVDCHQTRCQRGITLTYKTSKRHRIRTKDYSLFYLCQRSRSLRGILKDSWRSEITKSTTVGCGLYIDRNVEINSVQHTAALAWWAYLKCRQTWVKYLSLDIVRCQLTERTYYWNENNSCLNYCVATLKTRCEVIR